MATYYKVTNVSARTDKGERNIYLNEAGKLLRSGETAFNIRRLNQATKDRAQDRGLHIEEQSMPWKDPTVKVEVKEGAPKVKHKVVEAPDGIVGGEPAPSKTKHKVTKAPDGIVANPKDVAPAKPAEPETIDRVSEVSFSDASTESPASTASSESVTKKKSSKKKGKGKGSSGG